MEAYGAYALSWPPRQSVRLNGDLRAASLGTITTYLQPMSVKRLYLIYLVRGLSLFTGMGGYGFGGGGGHHFFHHFSFHQIGGVTIFSSHSVHWVTALHLMWSVRPSVRLSGTHFWSLSHRGRLMSFGYVIEKYNGLWKQVSKGQKVKRYGR